MSVTLSFKMDVEIPQPKHKLNAFSNSFTMCVSIMQFYTIGASLYKFMEQCYENKYEFQNVFLSQSK